MSSESQTPVPERDDTNSPPQQSRPQEDRFPKLTAEQKERLFGSLRELQRLEKEKPIRLEDCF